MQFRGDGLEMKLELGYSYRRMISDILKGGHLTLIPDNNKLYLGISHILS